MRRARKTPATTHGAIFAATLFLTSVACAAEPRDLAGTGFGTIDQQPAGHRLTRVEYANAIRDLFDLPLDLAPLLPDDAAEGPVDAGPPSPALLRRYAEAADVVSRLVLGRDGQRRQTKFDISPDEAQNRYVEGLPFGTRGGAAFTQVFPADGRYDFAVLASTPSATTPEQLELLFGDERIALLDGGQTAWNVSVAVTAGAHTVGVTFVSPQVPPDLDLERAVAAPFHPQLASVRIDGPLDARPATDLPSRRKLLVCRPTRAKEEKACARRIIGVLADRAFRGEASRRDERMLFAVYEGAARPAGFESGIEAVVRRVLTEPKFLYRAGIRADARIADTVDALQAAVYREDEAAVRTLVSRGADPRTPNREGATALGLAATRGSAAVLSALLQGNTKAGEPLPGGETPLMIAARAGNLAAMRVLLDAGADVNAKERRSGTTALMWAAAASNAPAVKLLIDAKADVAAISSTVALGPAPYLAETAAERLDRLTRGAGAASAPASRASRAPSPDRGGGLTALVLAARAGDLESVRLLLKAGARVDQQTRYGWTPLLTAIHHRHYRLAALLLEAGANPDLANQGGWNPLYLAADNRNIERGDAPAPEPDEDHLAMIRLLLDKGANVNARMRSSTATGTRSAQQWLHEEGATALLRAAQSGDLELVKLLLSRGADPRINTELGVTPLMAAAGVGWVEGVTTEWSRSQSLETLRLLIARGADVNARDRGDGRTALMGAAHKGDDDAVRLLVAAGAKLDTRDLGSPDSIGALAGRTWQALDYAEGLVRVGVQPAVAHPRTAALLRRLMSERKLALPPEGRTLESPCGPTPCRPAS